MKDRICAIQSKLGVTIDGEIGPVTLAAIEKALGIVPSMSNWYAIAMSELSVKEIAGDADNPRIIEYHLETTLKATSDEVPWCSSFVNWCFARAGIEGTRSAGARSWLHWGVMLRKPTLGCVVVLRRGVAPQGHVGFFAGEQNDGILVLGGNQSDAVNYRVFDRSSVLGYRWPANVDPTA